jgi:hypothetical protein
MAFRVSASNPDVNVGVGLEVSLGGALPARQDTSLDSDPDWSTPAQVTIETAR